MVIKAEQFQLDPNSEGTLQQQVQQLVCDGVLSGRFLSGERMPSSRKLADWLGVSRITVTLAYAELVANDYLTSRGRSGYFISTSAPPPHVGQIRLPVPNTVDWQKTLAKRYVNQSSLVRPPDWKDYPYPFIYGQPDAGLFDHDNWRRCAIEALGRKNFDSMTKDAYEQDDPKLVEYIVRNILPRRGIWARSDEVLITMGAQNALWLCSQILLGENRFAAIENPCYPGIRDILREAACKVAQVDVDDNGLPPERLPAEVDVVFTTASHQCPTNTTMSIDRRRDFLKKSIRNGFVVVEDDYEFEMAFQRAPTPALKSLDRAGTVVYIGSFSKSLFPGLRLGYIVGAPALIEEARALRSLVFRHPPGQLQRTTAYFLSMGYHDTMINRIGQAYRRRRSVMEKAIRDNNLKISSRLDQGGSSFWMRAPPGINTSALARELRNSGVVIEQGRAFFGPEQENHDYYRLAYSSIPSAKIPEGIRRIAAAMR
ncbi:PLP-dependent aminotransferase family protein [Roseibium hamelinense]|nr:PLP-dependent aminotransferase family protein [Roseibium hamelinense]MTI43815.1 PLP-dependent aminotransferase family protein [Roseibium hamelinense]